MGNACLLTIKPAITKIFGPRSLNWTMRDENSTDPDASKDVKTASRARRLHGSAAASITRDFERLNDEFPLYQVHIQGSQGIRDFSGGHDISVDREFKVVSSGNFRESSIA